MGRSSTDGAARRGAALGALVFFPRACATCTAVAPCPGVRRLDPIAGETQRPERSQQPTAAGAPLPRAQHLFLFLVVLAAAMAIGHEATGP